MIYEILLEAKEKQQLIAIYYGNEVKTSYVISRVKELDEDEAQIEVFDKNGCQDGFLNVNLGLVYHIEIGTPDLARLETLTRKEYFKEYLSSDRHAIDATVLSETDTLEHVHQNRLLAVIWLGNEFAVSGYVERFDDEYVYQKTYDQDGKPIGHTLIFRQVISNIFWNTFEEYALQKLIDARSGK